jgi:hypothetical protein
MVVNLLDIIVDLWWVCMTGRFRASERYSCYFAEPLCIIKWLVFPRATSHYRWAPHGLPPVLPVGKAFLLSDWPYEPWRFKTLRHNHFYP